MTNDSLPQKLDGAQLTPDKSKWPRFALKDGKVVELTGWWKCEPCKFWNKPTSECCVSCYRTARPVQQ